MREESEMIKAMKLALEALECINSPLNMTELRSVGRAITALRAAIDEASMQRLTDVQQEMEQKPVAWIDKERGAISFMNGTYGPNWKPVYTHPPRREWKGLTDEEIDRVWRSVDYKISYDNFRLAIARAIEAKLKERNT